MSNKLLHCLFCVLFLLVSVALTMGRVGTSINSFALLSGDMAVYVSMAAAQENPEIFSNDPFLSNEKNINSYNMIFFPLLKGLKGVFGNYGAACIFLLPLIIFLHLVGYYSLGVSIFKSPWAGLYVSLIISVPVGTYYDFWGVILDALPRFIYQALIPYLLMLSIVRGSNLKWWPAIMAGLGVLNYIHPVSTPAWATAMILALWVSVDSEPVSRKAKWMGLALTILAVTLLPFVASYFQSTLNEGSAVINYDSVIAALKDRFFMLRASGLVDVILNFSRSDMGFVHNAAWYLVVALGIAGVVYGLAQRRSSEFHAPMRQITAWMLGVFLCGAVLPIMEQAVFSYLRRIPPEFELLRTLRFMVPLILLSAFLFLWILKERFRQQQIPGARYAGITFVTISVALLTAWAARGISMSGDFKNAILQNIACWSKSRMICSLPERSMDYIRVMDAIRNETPPDSRILSEGGDVAIRYYSLRSLMYTYKDGAPLAYTDLEQFMQWHEQFQMVQDIQRLRKFPNRRIKYMNKFVEFAQTVGANFLLLLEPYNPELYYPEELTLVYTNGHYSLYRISP